MSHQNNLFENQDSKTRNQEPVECLGQTFASDEARREHFLGLLREGLEELHAKLGGLPFTTVEDTAARLKSLEKWPVGDDQRIRELAERMAQAARHGVPGSQFRVQGSENQKPGTQNQELLSLYKAEVGFPHGEIEDILHLSDPPYYTACPNPFIADFIKHYGKPYDPNVPYSKEPFAADVSEGKNDPIYNAHSYHTKVPHKAIMRYILHYTEPGDVVFDGFCGTGMTGVAAQLCGDRKTVESLGYKVDADGVIYQYQIDDNGKSVKVPFSKLGARRVILNDLSPAATLLSKNFNSTVNVHAFQNALSEIGQTLDQVEKEYWALNKDDVGDAQVISYIVWSDVFICENCSGEIVFWDAAVDKQSGKVASVIVCPNCNASFQKRQLQRPFVKIPKGDSGLVCELPKLDPVLLGLERKRRGKELETDDRMKNHIITQHLLSSFSSDFPDFPLDSGWEMYRHGMGKHRVETHWQLYIPGSAQALLKIWRSIQSIKSYSLRIKLIWIFTSIIFRASKFNRRLPSGGGAPITGVLYIPSMIRQENVVRLFRKKLKELLSKTLLLLPKDKGFCCINTGDFGGLDQLSNCVDYIFIDPPFGSNIFYADMNFLWESWIKVFTNRKPEAIVSDRALDSRKNLDDYSYLMYRAFSAAHKALKPGRWITVEFHNSANAVWNAIAEALQRSGFIIADVRTLDKKQKSFRQTTAAGAVKQDLIISAYKPNGGLEERFTLTAGTEEGVWDFVRTHLKQLPVFISKDGKAEVIAERQNYLLFDRMVAFHVQRGVTVPLSAAEFYAGLAQRFPERDGMYFLPEQVAEYDKKRMKVKEVLQLQLFVTDEASAIQWLKQQLTRKPQTFQELHPQFLKEIGGWQKHEKPLELSELLEQNFLMYDGKGPIPAQIVAWMKQSENLRKIIQEELAAGGATEENGQLETRNQELITRAKARWYVPDPNKAGDLEKLRERALLREFEEYRQSKQKRLKVFRLEAVRAGFKKAWAERDYATIIAVARKIPEKVLQEDPKLLMWYDQALTRMGET